MNPSVDVNSSTLSSPESISIDKITLKTAALKCGSWMLTNQIANRFDANNGRGVTYYDSKSNCIELTASWGTGIQCMCFLALFKRTGDQKYLDAAERAGKYICSLQVMDSREDRYYGTIREITPQSIEFAPRDATTAAWGLTWLYEATKKNEYLDRAMLFGNWHLKHGMLDGWPRYATYMDNNVPNIYAQGNFQGGTGLFYHDLFMISDEPRFVTEGLRPIANKYRDDFLDDCGSPIMTREAFSGKVCNDRSELVNMHAYNDDFSSAMLMAAADIFRDESYRKKALDYTKWLASQQNPDGTFEAQQYPSGISVSVMYFHDLGTHYNNQELLLARDIGLKKLLSLQFLNTENSRLDGAFAETYKSSEDFELHHKCVNNRTTAYALLALLKVESNLKNIWLGRHNKTFRDPEVSYCISLLKW
jgi:hypothetical protein